MAEKEKLTDKLWGKETDSRRYDLRDDPDWTDIHVEDSVQLNSLTRV